MGVVYPPQACWAGVLGCWGDCSCNNGRSASGCKADRSGDVGWAGTNDGGYTDRQNQRMGAAYLSFSKSSTRGRLLHRVGIPKGCEWVLLGYDEAKRGASQAGEGDEATACALHCHFHQKALVFIHSSQDSAVAANNAT